MARLGKRVFKQEPLVAADSPKRSRLSRARIDSRPLLIQEGRLELIEALIKYLMKDGTDMSQFGVLGTKDVSDVMGHIRILAKNRDIFSADNPANTNGDEIIDILHFAQCLRSRLKVFSTSPVKLILTVDVSRGIVKDMNYAQHTITNIIETTLAIDLNYAEGATMDMAKRIAVVGDYRVKLITNYFEDTLDAPDDTEDTYTAMVNHFANNELGHKMRWALLFAAAAGVDCTLNIATISQASRDAAASYYRDSKIGMPNSLWRKLCGVLERLFEHIKNEQTVNIIMQELFVVRDRPMLIMQILNAKPKVNYSNAGVDSFLNQPKSVAPATTDTEGRESLEAEMYRRMTNPQDKGIGIHTHILGNGGYPHNELTYSVPMLNYNRASSRRVFVEGVLRVDLKSGYGVRLLNGFRHVDREDCRGPATSRVIINFLAADTEGLLQDLLDNIDHTVTRAIVDNIRYHGYRLAQSTIHSRPVDARLLTVVNGGTSLEILFRIDAELA